jgi:isopenicillin-N N-acyltransferase-like protein
VIDIETSPKACGMIELQDGVVTHSNHFRLAHLADRDRGIELLPDSEQRYCRLEDLLKSDVLKWDALGLQEVLADHDGFPSAICRHADPTKPWQERIVTGASIVMDLGARRVWITAGPPCANPYEEVDWAPLLEEWSQSGRPVTGRVQTPGRPES